MIHRILIWPDPRLTRVAEPVSQADIEAMSKPDSWVRKLAADLVETMRFSKGFGLAAPQIGQPWRVAVLNTTPKPAVLLNPRRVEATGAETQPEGCLSVPWERANVERPTKLVIDATNDQGVVIVGEFDGNLARVVAHELDHLDGKLIVEHLSVLQRDLLRRKLVKRKMRGLRYKDTEDIEAERIVAEMERAKVAAEAERLGREAGLVEEVKP